MVQTDAILRETLKTPHWSTDIPLDTPHPRPAALAATGYVVLADLEPPIPEAEYLDLEYMDWKSGGDTNFAPIATADGELDCRGFWKPGDERADRGGRWTVNAQHCPSIVSAVQAVDADFGRVRVIKLEPQTYEDALRHIHRDDNNRFNPDGDGWVVRSWIELTDNPESFMVLMEQGPDGLPDPSTEAHVPLHRGSRFVVDTQRLWHVVAHPGTQTRYALISSFTAGPALDAWIAAGRP
jgi:peptidoglycan hydrolase-like protein with peptidoglycan-binding domain